MPKLDNAKHERFCREYMIDCCGKAAGIRAGYPEKSAEARAAKLRMRPDVRTRLTELQDEMATKIDVNATKILQEIARIAFARIDAYVTFGPKGVVLRDSNDLLAEELAAISEVHETVNAAGDRSVKFKLADKLAALEKLGKHLKLFTDVTEVQDKSMAQVVSEMRKDRLARERAGQNRTAGPREDSGGG